MMSIVLSIIAVYGLLHAYVFFVVFRTFSLHPAALIPLAVLLATMAAAPFLVRALDRHGYELSAQLLAWPFYFWMALLLWFCTLMLLMDLWNLPVRAAGRWLPLFKGLVIPHRVSFFLAVGLSLTGLLAGTVEAMNIRVKTVHLPTSKIPAGSPPIKILYVSDVHLDIGRGRRTMKHILRIARDLKPDLFLSGGDVVDTAAAHLKPYAEALEQFRPPLGKYGVLGNHEYYARLTESLAFYRMAGIELLRESVALVHSNLLLMGVDDPAGSYTRQPYFSDESALSRHRNRSAFTILLKHQPRISDIASTLCDLQLSGHTHGGQIFPFHLVVRLLYPWEPGLNNTGSLLLYVSRGAGAWGPPLRLLAPPDVTLIVLEPHPAP
ncbi:MAG: hypothetical protein A2X46_16880 [Lentisphaerae bacterium GWF2_57_35]|nr:MAG: hypothetical protein A2X46_16880 [Lentisphaerae bacterium GWF2_57_35]